jgi:3-deoxy-D-manno-octulosonic-acid transferase
VIILDTVGELAQLYRVATVVFVGGSLVPTGGHNMLEPALLRKAILFGPHTGNFRESADALLAAGGALLVRDGGELERLVAQVLGDLELRQRMGDAAFQALVGRQGAVKHTLELVERFLMEPAHG